MNKKILIIVLLTFITTLVTLPESSFARNWSDLHEEDENLFGSEKELKYNPDMFFLQRESWGDHYSFMFFWLFKYTDYPKYSSVRALPFFYSLDSKIDSRSQSFIPLTLTYWETDEKEKFKINPLFVAGSSESDNGNRESYSYSLIHGYTYTKRAADVVPERTWWAPIIPLIYRNTNSQGGHMNIGWIMDYTWDRKENGDENINRFWLVPMFFHKPGSDGYTHMLPPVFLYNRHINGEYWMSLLPLFIHSKSKVYNYTTTQKDQYQYEDSFTSLLFSYNNIYNDKWGGEEKSTQFWFPLIPLVYSYNEPGVESHRNVIGLIDWHNDAKGNTDRFWFIPFLFHKPGDDGYTHALPPVFLYNRHSNGEYWMSLIPLFIHSKDKVYLYSSEKKDQYQYEDSFTSILYNYNNIYKDKWGGDEKSTQFWFPLVPLVYSYNEPGVESHRNVIGLIDWHNDAKGNTDRFWFIPFLFHKPGDDGYTYALPPVFIYNRYTNGEYWMSLLPLFLHTKNKVSSYSSGRKTQYQYEDSFTSILYNYNNIYKDKWGGEEKSTQFWFPLIPLVYSSNEPGVESHRNIIGLIDWHNDADGNTDRFWFMPFYFSNNNSYRHILPPLYMSFYKSEKDNYSHLFPLYMSSRSKSKEYHPKTGKLIPAEERLFLTPLSGYSSVKSSEGITDIESKTYWFPIIPFYSHSEWNEGSHTNLLWAFDWGRDTSGKLERLFIMPFIFHKSGEGGYRYYFPFYFRPGGWSEKEGVSFSPFYYHRWSADEDIKWSWLIHYKNSNFKTGEYINTWMPLYYHHNEPLVGETTWLMPFYFHHDGSPSGDYSARIVAPLYWNFDTGKRDTTLFLPLYFETIKKNGKGSLYINILGYSQSILSGVNPVVDAGLGFNKKGIYVDMDASWLIDMFSLSTRITIPMKNGENIPDEEAPVDITKGDVTLSKKSGVNRDSSINFWGWHLFFGLVAFEKADTKRHFRLLPLSWITWDEASDERIKVIFNYISYKEKETEYLVFFPFYGYQREGESYSRGYLLNAFWHEYGHEENMHDYTVLWPIVNIYNSPKKSGWRVLPLVWHKNRIEENQSHSSTFTPIWMDINSRNIADGSTTYRLNLSPIHFYKYNEEVNEEKNEKSKLWFSTIPVVFYKYNETLSRYNIIEQYETLLNKNKKISGEPKTGEYTTSKTTHWLFPFYFVSETGIDDKTRETSTSDYTLVGLPFLYYHSITDINRKAEGDGKTKKKGSLFVMGYYNEFSSEMNSSNILFGLYASEKFSSKEDYSYSLLYGLFSISNLDGNYQNYFRPFYYYGNDHGRREKSALMGLFRVSDDSVTGNTGTSLLYYLFSTSLLHYTIEPDKTPITVGERETWGVPFFYYSNVESTDSKIKYSKNNSFSLLHYRENVEEASGNSYTFWAPIIPLYYYSSRASDVPGKSYSEKHSVSLLHYKESVKNTIEDSYTFWAPIVPLYYYSSRESDIPGKSYSEKQSISLLHYKDSVKNSVEDSNTFWVPIVPLYYYSNRESSIPGHPEKSESENLSISLLHYKESIKKPSEDSYTFWAPLVPLFYYSTDNESSHTNILWLADIEKGKKSDYTRFWLLPVIFSKTGNDGYFHIAPLFFYDWDKNSDDNTFIICGLYLHNMPGFSRQNFLYLYDHISESKENRDEYSFLFTTIEYNVDPEIKEMRAMWGLLADAEWNRKGYDIKGFLYLAAVERDGDYFHSRVLPVWYYESTENSHTLLIPPALTYDSKDSDESRFQLWGLGALWFRNYNPAEKSDFQAALLGIPYYKYQKAERGYETRGSVWGLLWEYETEKDTGFSKFSLLKFVYKRVEIDGEVTHKVLGISF